MTIVQMRTLWPSEQDIGWRNAAGEVTWHNARLAVAVETQGGSLCTTPGLVYASRRGAAGGDSGA